ncbi:MAG TPA: acetylxylan esterase [Pirellulales bacterium]|jgi:hypothetical protein|nr:acetylxylan esterase [Pirellulales bacterium]
MCNAAVSTSSLLLACGAILCGAALSFAASAAPAEFPDADQLPSVKQLPDPLVMFDGTPVTSKQQWLAERKPELKRLFQHYMYGNLPPAPKITATVDQADRELLGGKAIMKQVTIAFGPPGCPKLHLLVVSPRTERGHGAAPAVFLGLNFTGNHTVLSDPRIELPTVWMPDGPGVEHHKATAAGRGTAADKWQVESILDRGYALATFYYGDIAPDKPGLNEGVFPFFRPAGQTTAGPSDWASVAAWAWGAQRAVDYLVADSDVDGKRIVVFGHSRLGKAALLAGAFDDRIAAVIAHQAGCGGSAPSRGHNPKSEPVTRINTVFPHWFDGVFKTFNGREDRLPFDQNCLVGLCAPRPVLFGCGTLDEWADPPGQLEVLKGANSVYRLFGVDGIAADATAENDKIIGNRLCYFIRESPHTVNKEYWDAFMNFADRALPPAK